MTSDGSSIPGPKPPAAFVKLDQKNSALPVDHASPHAAHGKTDPPSDRVDAILNRSTSEIVDEAGAVVSLAVEESQTVGGLGVNLLTVWALVATSPWSWIGMLLFGPERVWRAYYAGVLAGIGSTLGLAVIVLLSLVAVVVAVVGWAIVRAVF